MKTITKDNIQELQIVLDTLLDIVNSGGQVIVPKLLTVNQTGSKWTEDVDQETYVTVNQTNVAGVLKDPNTLYINFIVQTAQDIKN